MYLHTIHPRYVKKENCEEITSAPVFPEGMPGLTAMFSEPVNDRCALYVALIVPDNKLYGTALSPFVGVTGAGSRDVPYASLKVSVPVEDAPSSDI